MLGCIDSSATDDHRGYWPENNSSFRLCFGLLEIFSPLSQCFFRLCFNTRARLVLLFHFVLQYFFSLHISSAQHQAFFCLYIFLFAPYYALLSLLPFSNDLVLETISSSQPRFLCSVFSCFIYFLFCCSSISSSSFSVCFLSGFRFYWSHFLLFAFRIDSYLLLPLLQLG